MLRSSLLSRIRTKALAHLEMTRPYTMFHSGMLGAAGAQVGAAGQISVPRTLIAALVDVCGWEAGLYAGDYYDRDIDARSKPYRAIPSGRVSAREAFLTMVGLIGAGYTAALKLGKPNLALAMATTALGISYSKTFKDQAILGNFDRGVLGACAVLFGGLAGDDLRKVEIAQLSATAFFHDSATNLVGAIRDVEGDRAAGCRTVPVVYGLGRSVYIACGLAAASSLMATSLIFRLQATAYTPTRLGTADACRGTTRRALSPSSRAGRAGVGSFLSAMLWQARRPAPTQPDDSSAVSFLSTNLWPRTVDTSRSRVSLALFAVATLLAARVYGNLLLTGSGVTRQQALTAHKYLVVERLLLMSSFVAVYNVPAALTMLVISIAGSVSSQILLRDRYERQMIGSSGHRIT